VQPHVTGFGDEIEAVLEVCIMGVTRHVWYAVCGPEPNGGDTYGPYKASNNCRARSTQATRLWVGGLHTVS
jgi:hypothetical protein